MFTLCITTLDRFKTFLKKNIPKYLENELISEIIISDENGNDIKLIQEHFPNVPKLKLFNLFAVWNLNWLLSFCFRHNTLSSLAHGGCQIF